MKIKDLPPNTNLREVRFIAPDGKKYYLYSQWCKGVWGKKDMDDSRVYPIFVKNLQETLEWEVVE